jgi:DNA-directed RNA polymerase subunit K/omega
MADDYEGEHMDTDDVNGVEVLGDELTMMADENDPSCLDDYESRKKEYKTPPYLTKYEKTKILAERAQQLTNGFPAFVTGNFTNTYEVALQELEEKKIPFILKRPYGNMFEYWKLKDLL